jgi:hypothetical protein
METRGSGHTSSGAGSRIELRQACSGPGSGIARTGTPDAPKLAKKAAIISDVFFVIRCNMRLLPLLLDHLADARQTHVTGGKRLRAKTETISPPL